MQEYLRNILFVVFGLLTGTVSGQVSRLYTTEDGMSANWVHFVSEDKLGFLWVGTTGGLNRFDGKNFEVYSEDAENPEHRLKNGEVYFGQGDNDGYFWVGTLTHLEIIDINTGKISFSISFKDLFNSRFGSDKLAGEVFFYINPANRYFLTFNGFLFELKREGELLTYDLISDYIFKSKLKFAEAKDGGIIIYSDRYCIRLVPEGKEWKKEEHIVYDDNPSEYLHRIVLMIYGVNSDNLFTRRDDFGRSEPFRFSAEISPFFFFRKDKNNRIWFYNQQNLHLLDINKGFVYDYSDLTTDQIAGSLIYSLHSSSKDVIWCGSFTGLLKISNPFPVFEKVFDRKNYENSMKIISLRGIAFDTTGNVYLPAANQIFRFNRFRQEIDSIQLYNPSKLWVSGLFHIYIDEEQKIWICGNINSMFQIQVTGKTFQIVKDQYYNIGAGHFLPIGNGKFWTAGQNFGLLDTKTHLFKPHPLTDSIAKSLPASAISFIYKASDGSIWLGGIDMVYHIPDPDCFSMEGIRKYSQQSQPEYRIVSNRMISEIREDSKHNIWIGTKGQGVYRINSQGKVDLHIGKKEGLSNNMIAGILESENGNLWISTFNGLNEYNPNTGKFRIYFKSDGITHNEFNIYSAAKDSSGRMFFGGVNGLTFFHPNDFTDIEEKNESFHLVFTAITCYAEAQKKTISLLKNQSSSQTIYLSPYDRLLNLQFALLNYVNSEANQFAYKIGGISDEWILLGNKSEIQLPYLSEGKYYIYIRAKIANGDWNKQELKLEVNVKAVYYRTWWFFLLLAGALAGIIIALYRYQVLLLQKRQQVRTDIAADLHDEVGSLLTRLSMQAEMLQFLPVEKVSLKLTELARTSKLAISYMRDIIWSVDAKNDSIRNLISRLEEQMEADLTPLNIDYKLDIQCNSLQAKIPPDLRQNFFLIFKEAIHNIVKHSQTHSVFVKLLHNEDELCLIIEEKHEFLNPSEENRKDKKQTSGNGLNYMKMRASRIKAELTIDKNTWTIILKKKFRRLYILKKYLALKKLIKSNPFWK